MPFTLEEKADLLIFDVDGVLIDTSLSFPMVVKDSIQWIWQNILNYTMDGTGFTLDHFYAAKQHEAFNDDYNIAWAFLCAILSQETKNFKDAVPPVNQWERLLIRCDGNNVTEWVIKEFGERISRSMVRRICEEFYFGSEDVMSITGRSPLFIKSSKGYWKREKPQISCHWKKLPLPSGIYTGRSKDEMNLALSLLGWEDFPNERIVTPESGITKPSPKGIEFLCSLFNASYPLYFGDAESDRKSLESFGKGVFIAIGPTLLGQEFTFSTTAEALSFLFGQKR